jgi:hypothetical protein
MQEDSPPSTIKSIVLSGGGSFGFSMYGVLRESHKSGFWDLKNIETIYGTSVGSIIGVMISLNYDWETLDNYLIDRPWQNIFKFTMYSLIDAIQQKGIFDISVIQQIFSPLFCGKDIPLDITMAEYYEKTKIELHFYTLEINHAADHVLDISHLTCPDWKLLDAIYASSCLPILFSPLQKEECFYIDGGIYNNYPIQNSLNQYPLNPDCILGICMILDPELLNNIDEKNKIDEKSNLFEYMFYIMYKIIRRIIMKRNVTEKIKNEVKIKNKGILFMDIYNASSSKEERQDLIELGVKSWQEFKPLKN